MTRWRAHTDLSGSIPMAVPREPRSRLQARRLILGIGQEGKVTSVSLQNDSPHTGLSMDTGGGKSVTVRGLVAQILFRGGIALVLDNKLVSHPSLRGLPNVTYADDIAKIHDVCVWLDSELDRRARYIRANTNIYGELTGSPGPRLVVIAEELNLTMARLKAYWDELIAEDRALPKDERENLPASFPAVRGLANCSFVGRELRFTRFSWASGYLPARPAAALRARTCG